MERSQQESNAVAGLDTLLEELDLKENGLKQHEEQLHASAITFIEVVHQAPRLMELLPPESLKALSGVCHFLHRYCRSLVRGIMVADPSDMRHILSKAWPKLGLIFLSFIGDYAKSHDMDYYDSLLNDQWTSRWSLVLWGEEFRGDSVGAIIWLVNPAQADLNQSRIISQAHHAFLLSWLRSRLSGPIDVRLLRNCLGAAGFKYLSSGNWPNLVELDLCGRNVHAHAVAFLVQGQWSGLRALNLSNNQLDALSIAYLVKGNWPYLTRLDLSCNDLDATAVAQLIEGNWSELQMLDLSFNSLQDAGVMCLSQGNWPNLQILRLCRVGLDALGAQYVSDANWRKLQYLYLQGNEIGAAVATHLVNGLCPCLMHLEVGHNDVTEAAYTILGVDDVQQQLAALETCRKRNSSRGLFALQRNTKAKWPLMRAILISEC